MFNLVQNSTETIKPLVFSLPNRFAEVFVSVFTPQSSKQPSDNDRVTTAISLQRMANDIEAIQPSLAAELRSFASRS